MKTGNDTRATKPATAVAALLDPWAAAFESLADGPRSEALAADRRFDDPAWHGHAGYRALGETYLAWGRQLHAAIDALPLPGR
jgi:hypothetical protein